MVSFLKKFHKKPQEQKLVVSGPINVVHMAHGDTASTREDFVRAGSFPVENAVEGAVDNGDNGQAKNQETSVHAKEREQKDGLRKKLKKWAAKSRPQLGLRRHKSVTDFTEDIENAVQGVATVAVPRAKLEKMNPSVSMPLMGNLPSAQRPAEQKKPGPGLKKYVSQFFDRH